MSEIPDTRNDSDELIKLLEQKENVLPVNSSMGQLLGRAAARLTELEEDRYKLALALHRCRKEKKETVADGSQET